MLSGLNKERVSYDQLSITQWVPGFGQTMREESDPNLGQHILDYLIALMDHANDFSWTSAKASNVILLCQMEQGEVKDFSDIFANNIANNGRTFPHAEVDYKSKNTQPIHRFRMIYNVNVHRTEIMNQVSASRST